MQSLSEGSSVFASTHDVIFTACVIAVAVILYCQTLFGGFVWDDRAAIVGNGDVTGANPWYQVFHHDFWGQEITLADSHKSYRPVTTLSFRANHAAHGLAACGFHAVNVLLYACVVGLVHIAALQWLSTLSAARSCTLLFCFHPVHVEAVSSVVGRADSLCCLFYLGALIAYTIVMREKGALRWLHLSAAFILALFASLSKEIGVTVFGVFLLAEVAQTITERRKRNVRCTQRLFCVGFNECLCHTWTTLTSSRSGSRVAVVLFASATFSFARVRLNGPHNVLYAWSILENHIHLLPSWFERSNSYAQTHFWYLAKLFFPRHLCFDYGYACIPTIHSLGDPRNFLPLLAYLALGFVIVHAVQARRSALLLGIALLLLPLLPALNFLIPVGTTLAERLLFTPSVGFCFLAGELITVDLVPSWVQRGKRTNFLTIIAGIFCFLGTARIVSRNLEWGSEIAVYQSALAVCPLSAKALANYAMLCANDDSSLQNNFHNCLGAVKSAVDVYSGQHAAFINAGVVQSKLLGRSLHAIHEWSRVADSNDGGHSLQSKALGYYGKQLLEWIEQQDGPLAQAALPWISEHAVVAIDKALRMGFEPPNVLLARGSAALVRKDYDLARRYLMLTRDKIRASNLLAPDAPQADGASLSLVCPLLRQLGEECD
jgi:hypothetical protein